MYKNILIINTTGMGDCLWGTPALRSLKESFSGISLHFLVNEKWIALFKGNPNIDYLYAYRHTYLHQLLLAIKLRKFSFEKILIFHANKGIQRFIRMLKPADILSHQSFPWIHPGNCLVVENKIHGIQRNLELIKKIGATKEMGKMEIYFEAQDYMNCKRFMEENGLKDKEMIYFNVGGAYPSRRWPVDFFAQLLRKISKSCDFRVILGGAVFEKEQLLKIKSSASNPETVVLSCDLPLKTDAVLIKKSRLLITSDTGPMHIGFAVGTPTISIYGPTDHVLSGPYKLGDQMEGILQSDEICPGCDYVVCKTPTCMEKISAEMVMEKVSYFLNKN